MSDIKGARTALVARILGGEGHAPAIQRRAAFNNAGLPEPVATLIDKVAKSSHNITDEDIAGTKASGLSEDQIFELVVCAAVGQAARQYDDSRTRGDCKRYAYRAFQRCVARADRGRARGMLRFQYYGAPGQCVRICSSEPGVI